LGILGVFLLKTQNKHHGTLEIMSEFCTWQL
jgi:hypothetical protein